MVDPPYGGSGASFRSFASFLTRMATVNPSIAGLASVHGCLGAVSALRTFGSEAQKQRLLPMLARGERLSAFALTEPGAGTDLTALRTRAERVGDEFVVNGEKLFVTNAAPGRTISLVCLIEDAPAVLICDLPRQPDEHVQWKEYGLWTLKHTHNRGIVLRDFRVPASNRLDPGGGTGLSIVYHGLNLGRISLCSTAAGSLRRMMANMIPWAHFRVTFGQRLARRELVRRRLGRMAALTVGCDALAQWCSGLVDQGYRAELEGITAKVFASGALKEAATDLLMRTHGGRSFLRGHLFGDSVHDYVAPGVYEGEDEMLGMAFFRSLARQRSEVSTAFQGQGGGPSGVDGSSSRRSFSLGPVSGLTLAHLTWRLQSWVTPRTVTPLPGMPERLGRHAKWACDRLRDCRMEIWRAARRWPWTLADRQCRMAEISQRVRSLVVILTTSLYASQHPEGGVVQQAADVLGEDLVRQWTGCRPTDQYFHRITRLGAAVAEGAFESIAEIAPDEILMPYPGP
jgi:alkylation response protein AidB-like acyl-CoA dehydrogenase